MHHSQITAGNCVGLLAGAHLAALTNIVASLLLMTARGQGIRQPRLHGGDVSLMPSLTCCFYT